jgi:hypothetical protein
MKALALTVAAVLAVSGSAWAGGGKNKNRLAERQDQIAESQLLCEETGVETIVIRDESGEITIACHKLAPESAPAAEAP